MTEEVVRIFLLGASGNTKMKLFGSNVTYRAGNVQRRHGDMVLKRMSKVLVCPKRIHRSSIGGKGGATKMVSLCDCAYTCTCY